MGDLNNRNLFLAVLEAEKSKIKVLAEWFLVRALFLVCRQPHSHCALTWWKGSERKQVSCVSCYEYTNPIGSEPRSYASFNLNYLRKALSANIVVLGFEASIYKLGGGVYNLVQSMPVEEFSNPFTHCATEVVYC